MNHPFEQTIADAVARHGLLRQGDRVVVALSGGADSVALLAVLTALGYDCVAAHCNFHLRGDESTRDMRHAERITAALGVDLCVRDFDVAARREATGESVEMACRELRYRWFDELLDNLRARAIAVGHHSEDNVETLFLNLFRGTGIAGLTGMQWRNAHVIRPMLGCSRADIELYLRHRGLDYVTDSSNASSEFRRNRLRNELLPMAEKLFPGASEAVTRTIAHTSESFRFYQRAVRDAIGRYTDAAGAIDIASLSADPDARLLLYEAIKPLGFNMTHADNMLRSVTASGLKFESAQTTLRLDRGILKRQRGAADPGETAVTLRRDILTPVNIEVSLHDITEFSPERDPAVIYLDASVCDGDPQFTIRPWRKGDRLEPFGMDGSKLVSDILNDAKADSDTKRHTMVLTRNGRLLWVVGMRASRHYAVTPATRSFLRLRLTGRHHS